MMVPGSRRSRVKNPGGRLRGAPRERFERHFVVTPGCWLWTASTKGNGYGQFGVGSGADRKNLQAHRASYEFYVGPIPPGLEIDHLCRVRSCVNPAHLEPVTPLENTRRAAAVRTSCRAGHPYVQDVGSGYRCEQCRSATVARSGASRTEAARRARGGVDCRRRYAPEDKQTMREAVRSGASRSSVAESFGCAIETVSRAVRGRSDRVAA